MKKILISILTLTLSVGGFAQLPQLKSEVVNFYHIRDIAVQSRILNSNNVIEKYEDFLNHPLFCETAFGFEYIDFVEVLLKRGEYRKAEKYLLKTARSHYMNASDKFIAIFNRTKQTWPDTVFAIPRTPESIKFKETVLEKMLEIEEKRNIDPRFMAIVHEIGELAEKESVNRNLIHRTSNYDMESINKSDSVIIYRLIELIKENPDIDIMRINMRKSHVFNVVTPYFDLGDVRMILHHVLRHRSASYAETAWDNFFEAYFRERAEQGKGLDYCFWYDTRLSHGKYGFNHNETYYGMTLWHGNPVRLSVDRRKEVNENREKVGLSPLTR
jgi:hypothetical protein